MRDSCDWCDMCDYCDMRDTWYGRLWFQEMLHLLNFSGDMLVTKYFFPFILAIDLVSDWDERAKWDKTFDGISFLDQMADFKLLKWWAIFF